MSLLHNSLYALDLSILLALDVVTHEYQGMLTSSVCFNGTLDVSRQLF